jgi:hypothetical protein
VARPDEESFVQLKLGGDLLDRLLRHLLDVVPDAVGVGISVLMSDQPPRVVNALGAAEELDPLQWRLTEGPLVDARCNEQPAVSDDLAGDERWPRLRQAMRQVSASEVRGVVVLPGTWDDGGPVLLSVYLDQKPTDEHVHKVLRLEPLLATSLALVEYCSGEVLRADQMLEMMQYRRVIEQAKGLVMGALSCDGNEAFDTLTRASQHFNVRVRDLAIALVEHVGCGPAEQPEDPTSIAEPSPRTRGVGAMVWTAITHREILPPDRRSDG